MLCGNSSIGKLLDAFLTIAVVVAGLIWNGIKGIAGLITGQTQKNGGNAIDNAGKSAIQLAHNAGDRIYAGYENAIPAGTRTMQTT